MRAPSAGTVEIAGTPPAKADPRAAQRAGLAHVPEDRMHTGLSPSLPIEDNLALTAQLVPPRPTGPSLRPARPRPPTRELAAPYAARAPVPGVLNLSPMPEPGFDGAEGELGAIPWPGRSSTTTGSFASAANSTFAGISRTMATSHHVEPRPAIDPPNRRRTP